MKQKALIAAAALLLVSHVTLADDGSLRDRILACAEHSDASVRLACYDEEAAVLSESTMVDVENAAAANIDETAETATAPASVAEAAVPAAGAGASVDQFGMTPELAEARPDLVHGTELREITAIAVEVSRRARGEHIVTLDNGQTWVEKDAEPGFRVRIGDSVVITKGRMGGYRMTRGYRSSPVRRIN